MPQTLYQYSVSTDTFDGTALASCVYEDIMNSSLSTPGVDYVLIEGDDLNVFMTDTLSGGEETTLNGLIAATYETKCGTLPGHQDRVAVSENDDTTGYLSEKLVEGTAIDLTILNPGGVETLQVNVDINELTQDTAPAVGDFLITYDISASAHKKISLANLALTGLPGDGALIGAWQDSNKCDPKYRLFWWTDYKNTGIPVVAAVPGLIIALSVAGREAITDGYVDFGIQINGINQNATGEFLRYDSGNSPSAYVVLSSPISFSPGDRIYAFAAPSVAEVEPHSIDVNFAAWYKGV